MDLGVQNFSLIEYNSKLLRKEARFSVHLQAIACVEITSPSLFASLTEGSLTEPTWEDQVSQQLKTKNSSGLPKTRSQTQSPGP